MVHVPSIGRIVHYYQGDNEAPAYFEEAGVTKKLWTGTNGTRVHPAVITRVWSDTCVNLFVFLDAKGLEVRASATHLPNEVFAPGMHCENSGWRWPERVS